MQHSRHFVATTRQLQWAARATWQQTHINGNINLAARYSTLSGASPLLAAAHHCRVKAVAALLAAGSHPHTRNRDGHNVLAVAALEGHMQIVRLVLQTLLAPCDHHEPRRHQPNKQQQQQRVEQQGQQQDQHQQQPSLIAVVAGAVVFLTVDCVNNACCARLLEVVLDVLGLQTAQQVCQDVQQQLQEEWEHPQAQPAAHLASMQRWKESGYQVSWLAEALLLGYVGAEERLHAARQPLVARLQRLVPGVGTAEQHKQAQVKKQRPEHPWDSLAHRLHKMVEQAEMAAAAGQEQHALGLLQQVAALYLQHKQDKGKAKAAPSQSACDPTFASLDAVTTQDGSCSDDWDSECMVIQGLMGAGYTRVLATHHANKVAAPVADQVVYGHAASFHPPGVYTTFLAAWVGARRQLQQLPSEVVTTVVAAVQAAQQLQEQQQQEQQLPQEAARTVVAAGKVAQQQQQQQQWQRQDSLGQWLDCVEQAAHAVDCQQQVDMATQTADRPQLVTKAVQTADLRQQVNRGTQTTDRPRQVTKGSQTSQQAVQRQQQDEAEEAVLLSDWLASLQLVKEETAAAAPRARHEVQAQEGRRQHQPVAPPPQPQHRRQQQPTWQQLQQQEARWPQQQQQAQWPQQWPQQQQLTWQQQQQQRQPDQHRRRRGKANKRLEGQWGALP